MTRYLLGGGIIEAACDQAEDYCFHITGQEVFLAVDIDNLSKRLLRLYDYENPNNSDIQKAINFLKNDVLAQYGYTIDCKDAEKWEYRVIPIDNSFPMEIREEVSESYKVSILLAAARKSFSEGDYKSTILKSYNMLDLVLHNICKKHKININKNSLKNTFENIHNRLKAKKDFPNNILKMIEANWDVIEKLKIMVDNLAVARNTMSDAHNTPMKVEKYHARLCLDQTISIANFFTFLINEDLEQEDIPF